MVASKASEGDFVSLKITLEKQATRVLHNKTQMFKRYYVGALFQWS